MPSESTKAGPKTPEPKSTLRYRILRYSPDLVRDEWVNIGVLLEGTRVRRLHPDADEDLLRALPVEFDARLRGPDREVFTYLEKLEQNLSNVLQFGPQRGLLAENFDDELDRLYRDHVAPPSRRAGGILQSTRDWMREKLNDVFRRHRVLGKLEQRVRVEGFTQPGDPLRLDYGCQNGVRGFIHSISLRRDIPQAKVLAYTAECIHAHDSRAQIIAITELEPATDNPRHQLVEKLFAEQQIRMVPLNRVESFAEELRLQLN
jgi:Protein of unknown function (DUF3037)